MVNQVQLLGATLLVLAFVDIGRRWGGPYPPRLSPASDERREILEVAALFLLSVGSTSYGILVYRDVLAFNPVVVPFGGQGFTLVFVLGAVAAVIVPAALELGVRGRSIHDLGVRMPINRRPAILLVGMGVVLGAAPLAFGFPEPQSTFTLLLALYTPVFEEEFLYRGVIQSKLERVLPQERAWVVAGVLFGLSHVPNDFFGPFWLASGGDPIIAALRLAEQTAAGLLYGLLYMKSRTLAAPILAHYCSNKLAAVVSTVWG
jgi:membrane protease YdiL (CAAX protease family)